MIGINEESLVGEVLAAIDIDEDNHEILLITVSGRPISDEEVESLVAMVMDKEQGR